jgi:hypothetical protein
MIGVGFQFAIASLLLILSGLLPFRRSQASDRVFYDGRVVRADPEAMRVRCPASRRHPRPVRIAYLPRPARRVRGAPPSTRITRSSGPAVVHAPAFAVDDAYWSKNTHEPDTSTAFFAFNGAVLRET